MNSWKGGISMNDRFPNDVDTLLSGLTWEQKDSNAVLSVLKGEQPKMKRKVSLGLVLAIVLVLLVAVALAIGLSYSPRYSAIQSARQAVIEKYGLTQEMLRLYAEEVNENDGATTVIFHGNHSEFLKADAMGEYTAVVDGKGIATATWSHDGTDSSFWQNSDLTAKVWGAPQLQMVLDRYVTYQQWLEKTPYLSLLPIAEQAARMAELDEAIAPIWVFIDRTEIPDNADIPEDEALTLAKQGLKDHYGIEANESWRIERSFHIHDDDTEHSRRYSFTFQKGGEDTPLESYQIWVLSPTGEVATGQNTLYPDGSIIEEEATSQVAPITTPVVGLTEAEAISAATQALHHQYSLTDEMLTFFTAVPSLDATDGNTAWTVAFLPMEISPQHPGVADWRWNDKLTPKLGSYVVQLDAVNGNARTVSWSLDGMEDTSAYTQSNWANAKVYDAHILPWVIKLLSQNSAIIARYPDDQTEWFSIEDAAAYDQAFRDAGFDAGDYNHALPQDGDLTVDQALAIARQAMQNNYGLTKDQLDACKLPAEYVLDNGGEWWIGIYCADGMGCVKLNAVTGEIQEAYLDSAASANS